ncbi:MAG: glycosyltransferase [Bacteroidales bacterium]
MEKEILLLTTIYPLPDSSNVGTPVCHYFTKEWVKMGYNVQVIHIQAVYPFFLYWIAKLCSKFIRAKTGEIVYTKKDKEAVDYWMDNVHVHRVPTFKVFPHRKFTKKSITKLKRYVDMLSENMPEKRFDCAVGHFTNPVLEILSYIKQQCGTKTALVLHSSGIEIKTIYKGQYQAYFEDIDVWGYRSQPIQQRFEHIFGKMRRTFMCYSGIPHTYILSQQKEFETPITKFVFLGSLFKLKNVSTILNALKLAYTGAQFELKIIGEGAELSKLKQKSIALGINDCVQFMGRLPRQDAQKVLSESDCFVMVSSPEAFGLVYLEAMANGCITIGSKGEGIDGVIKHGENGFLCVPGDASSLAQLILEIKNLSLTEIKQISNNAVKTAEQLTDTLVAHRYLDSIFPDSEIATYK